MCQVSDESPVISNVRQSAAFINTPLPNVSCTVKQRPIDELGRSLWYFTSLKGYLAAHFAFILSTHPKECCHLLSLC